MAESEEELKSLLMKMKEERKKKTGLKFNIQETKTMTYSPITPWQIVGETMETVKDFISLGFKITKYFLNTILKWILFFSFPFQIFHC